MFKKLKKQIIYDFKYKIYWKDGSSTEGEIKNSSFDPADIFLTRKITAYGNGIWTYYNLDEIKQIEITDFVEKIG